ncbi:sugar ABC transporter ATP-binding protein [Mesorhizobium sp. M7D.F.Ca.US.005.01.1.1]|uniref:sugar ABC transporter ATP-binding protein n=1 Tax=Mesorhizobium sp. M7D.F.Ca.US.005.01.1.1 TaxID=2493678 RepID=UPI000F75BBB2|nr:sugar ABC transporter ATP-binding protein [Mesorhizobium sp. M7D.F.Ca.US.005.01.1.1]AZO44313.1 sugar ABC transporter ATP-binding protein [Mesorhizobium sp. M7D.F.Ca.US.005.01.1.1]
MIEQSSISPSSEAPLLRVEGVRKRFGGVNALRGVSLEIQSGEVHALLGENGAGKSTLIKILSGVHVHDGGSIEIEGKPVSFASPGQSRNAGVAVVYQDLSLVESLTVADNLLLGREPKTRLGFLKKRQLVAQAEAFLKSQNIPLNARAMVGSLPFAYRQMTEIAKALMGDVRLLILDEPTSALTDDEEKILFEAIRAVAARGVGVIYVTHRLNEVFRISNRVTVFRDGQNAGTFVTSQTNMRQLVGAIVGPDHAVLKADSATAGQSAPPARHGSAEKPVLELTDVSNDRLDRTDLALRSGEIHGLAGLIGSGRTEILQTIFGLRPVQSGEASLDGVSLKGTDPAAAIRQGIALVPEDRHVQGLVLEHSIERNLTLPRLPYFSRLGWLQRRSASEHANAAMRRLAVKAPGTLTLVKNLSGGNQQKVVFGKWNEPRPRVLLLDEPTVGVDVGAREEIYGVIRAAATAGSGVLLVSSDLSELLQLCDRISIVVDGRITRTISRAEFGSAEDLHHLIQLSQPSEEHAA